MNTVLHAIAQFVTANQVQLRLASYIFFGISGVFGGKGLGRVSWVKEQGGLYTALLVALPGAFFAAAILYGFDTLSGYGVTQGLRAALQWSHLTPAGIAIAVGALGGAVPPLLLAAQHYAAKRGATAFSLVHFTADVIGALIIAFTGFAMLAIGARVVFVVDGWLGGTPPPTWALFALALLWGSAFMLYTHRSANDQQGRLTSVAYLVAMMINLISLAGLICFGLIVGWIVLFYLVVTSIVGLGLLPALRKLAENLSSQQLVAVFGFPTIMGGVIQYLLAFPDVIPH